jgi:putative copper resistance protein D
VPALLAATVPVRVAVLLTGFQTGPLSLFGDALECAALVLFLLALRRLRARGRAFPPVSVACFSAGILALFVALGSGLAAYDDTDFPCHVIQHLLLMMVAPPLLALGRPVTLCAQAGSRRLQRAVIRLARSAVARRATGLAVIPLYYGAMWVAFLTPLYRLDVTNNAVHELTHLCLFLLGYLYWQGIVGREPSPAAVSPLRRVALLMVGGPVEGALGVLLLARNSPLFRQSLGSTRDGGGVFIVGAMLVSATALTLLVYDWARRDEQRVRRLDRLVAGRDGEDVAALDRSPLVGERAPLH